MTSSTMNANCGSITFKLANPQNAVSTVMDIALAPGSPGAHIHFANAYSVVLAQEDSSLAGAFSSGICFPDGKPVVWAVRLLHRRSSNDVHQVRGPSFFEEFMREGVPMNVRHYLLGSTPETLSKLTESLSARIPGVQIVGTSSPPFRHVTDQEWRDELDRIRASQANVVWIGLGTPKQDLIAEKLNGIMPSTYICVGAAFDFSAGNLRHAPRWMQRAGLEWLFRFVQEPRRLWKRYVFGNCQFIFTVASQFVSREKYKSL